jgi:protein involved in polysaccharide export with SLBB domain
MKIRPHILALLVTLLAAVPVAGQSAPGWDPGSPNASRAELQELLKRLEETSKSETYSEGIRQKALEQAALVKKRLEEGDMQFNDGITIDVKGAPHEALTNSYGVSAERKILVPKVGEISVAGVLRSELETYLTSEFSKSLKGFTLTVRMPIRLEIAGAVVKEGPAYVPPELSLLEVITLPTIAGGVKPEGVIENLRVLRDGKVVLDGKEWELARTEKRSLEDLGLRTGDVVQVPTRAGGVLANARKLFGAFSGIFSLLMVAQRLGVL